MPYVILEKKIKHIRHLYIKNKKFLITFVELDKLNAINMCKDLRFLKRTELYCLFLYLLLLLF